MSLKSASGLLRVTQHALMGAWSGAQASDCTFLKEPHGGRVCSEPGGPGAHRCPLTPVIALGGCHQLLSNKWSPLPPRLLLSHLSESPPAVLGAQHGGMAGRKLGNVMTAVLLLDMDRTCACCQAPFPKCLVQPSEQAQGRCCRYHPHLDGETEALSVQQQVQGFPADGTAQTTM